MDRGAWGAAVHGVAERDTTEQSLLGTLLGTLHAQHLRHRASFWSKTSPHTMLEKLRGEGLSNRKEQSGDSDSVHMNLESNI